MAVVGASREPVVFASSRLYARQFVESDAPDVFAMWTDPAVRRHIGNEAPVDLAVSVADVLRWRAVREQGAGCGFWAVLGADGEFVGDVFVRRIEDRADEHEIGWHLVPAHWGKGLATEIAGAAIRYAHEQGVRRLVALIAPPNVASVRVAEKSGMRFEGLSTRYDPDDDPAAVYASERG